MPGSRLPRGSTVCRTRQLAEGDWWGMGRTAERQRLVGLFHVVEQMGLVAGWIVDRAVHADARARTDAGAIALWAGAAATLLLSLGLTHW
jgi:hypothetical protein